MFVRTASKRDLGAVRALLVETWHDTYDVFYGSERVAEITSDWHSLAALEARLNRPGSEFLVADDGETIAGMAFASTAEDGRAVIVEQLYVRPGFQSRGIGGQLLDEVESCFPQANLVRLQVEEGNEGAIALYKRNGYSEAGRSVDAGQGMPALVMEKQLVL